MTRILELVLKEKFDTSHKIIWIAIDHPIGNLSIKLNYNRSNLIQCINEIDSMDVGDAGIDVVIERR